MERKLKSINQKRREEEKVPLVKKEPADKKSWNPIEDRRRQILEKVNMDNQFSKSKMAEMAKKEADRLPGLRSAT